MATVLLTLDEECSGRSHVKINVQINSVDRGTFPVTASDVLVLPDDEEIPTIIGSLIRLRLIGRTMAQVRNDLIAGLTITV